MVTKLNNFEGLSSGTAITPSNSGGISGDPFDDAQGSVFAQASGAIQGAVSLTATLAASLQSYVSWFVSGNTHFVVIAFTTDSGSTTHNKRMLWNGVAGNGSLGFDVRQIVASERIGLALRNVNKFELGPSGGGTGTLARSTKFIVAAKWVTGVSGSIDAWLYDATGTTLLDSNTFSGAVDAATELKYGVGNGSSTSSVIVEDSVGYSDTFKLINFKIINIADGIGIVDTGTPISVQIENVFNEPISIVDDTSTSVSLPFNNPVGITDNVSVSLFTSTSSGVNDPIGISDNVVKILTLGFPVSVADSALNTLAGIGLTQGSVADRELAYLTSKTAVGKSFADKAVALGRKPRPYLGDYS